MQAVKDYWVTILSSFQAKCQVTAPPVKLLVSAIDENTFRLRYKKFMLSQGNRAMPQLFFSV